MTVREAIMRIRSSVHDVAMEFSDEELLRFLNTGIADVAARCVAANATDFVRSVRLADGDALPEGFVRTAGQFPLRVEEGRVFLPPDVTKMQVRYFFLPRTVGLADERLPLRGEHLQELAVRAAVILVLNEHEFDVSQDLSLLGTLAQDATAAENTK